MITKALIKQTLVSYGLSPSCLNRLQICEKTSLAYLPCINRKLAGHYHPKTKIRFVSRVIRFSDFSLVVVVPRFTCLYKIRLSEDEIFLDRDKQIKASWKHLEEDVNALTDPGLKARLREVIASKARWTWHHDYIRGQMLLVSRSTHSKTGHTGGYALWGHTSVSAGK